MFGSHLDVFGIGLGSIRIYYAFVFVALMFMLYRHRKHLFSVFMVMLFFYGFFGFMGKAFQDLYKICIAGASVYWLVKTASFKATRRTTFPIVSFALFTVAFFATAFINGDYFTITFSQYFRFFTSFALLLIFLQVRESGEFKVRLNTIIYELITLQILLSVWKFVAMGMTESIVGSVQAQGGASGTVFPLLAFMYFWIRSDGKMTRGSWLYVLGLIFIGMMSLKRAIWFIFPFVLAGFVYYIPKKRIPTKAVLLGMAMLPLLLYLGVRMNPTLNKEHRFWGSFDPQWTWEYVMFYSFGEEQNGIAVGRGGATVMLLNKIFTGDLDENDLFGRGNKSVYGTSVEEFNRRLFGINSKGAATGFFQYMGSNGLIGAITLLLFLTSILLQTRNFRLRVFLFLFFSWEFFFYTGIIMKEFALIALFLYIVVMSPSRLPQGRKPDEGEPKERDSGVFAVPNIPG